MVRKLEREKSKRPKTPLCQKQNTWNHPRNVWYISSKEEQGPYGPMEIKQLGWCEDLKAAEHYQFLEAYFVTEVL